tara:strand:- start:121 stop:717 length:597 start_codon:yes stop_codon:yes gene_type:complete
MNINDQFQEEVRNLLNSELLIKDGDKIVYFVFSGSNNCFQGIEIEDHEDDDSQFFIEEYEPVIIGCYFYLPDEKFKLEQYLSSGNFIDWVFPEEEEYINEILNYEKNLIIIETENLEVKYPEDTSNGGYGEIYKRNNGKYLKVNENLVYDYCDENFTVCTSVEEMLKVIFINCQSSEEFEILDLGQDPLSIINKLKDL